MHEPGALRRMSLKIQRIPPPITEEPRQLPEGIGVPNGQVIVQDSVPFLQLHEASTPQPRPSPPTAP